MAAHLLSPSTFAVAGERSFAAGSRTGGPTRCALSSSGRSRGNNRGRSRAKQSVSARPARGEPGPPASLATSLFPDTTVVVDPRGILYTRATTARSFSRSRRSDVTFDPRAPRVAPTASGISVGAGRCCPPVDGAPAVARWRPRSPLTSTFETPPRSVEPRLQDAKSTPLEPGRRRPWLPRRWTAATRKPPVPAPLRPTRCLPRRMHSRTISTPSSR